MTDLIRYGFMILGACTFFAVLASAIVGGYLAAREEWDSWRARRARERAEDDAHYAALRDPGLGVVWIRRREGER